MLMIDAVRSFGLAARFSSGYLALPVSDSQKPTSDTARGSTHRVGASLSARSRLDRFDPTNGGVGHIGLVTVAVAPDPRHAIPLHGTFFGFPSDYLGMEVAVSAISGALKANWPFPERPCVDELAGWA